MAIEKKTLFNVTANTEVVLGASTLVDNEILGREIRKIIKPGLGVTVTENSNGEVVISSDVAVNLDKRFQSTMVNKDDKSNYPLLWTDVSTGGGIGRHCSPNGSLNGYVYTTDNYFHIFYNGNECLFYDNKCIFSFRVPYGFAAWYHDALENLGAQAAVNKNMKVIVREGGLYVAGGFRIYDYFTKSLTFQYKLPQRVGGNASTGVIYEDEQVHLGRQIRFSVNDKTGNFILQGELSKTYESWSNDDHTAITVNTVYNKMCYWVFDAEKLKFIKWNSETQQYDEYDDCNEDSAIEFPNFNSSQYGHATSNKLILYRNFNKARGSSSTYNWIYKVDDSSESLNTILDKDGFQGLNTDTYVMYNTDTWISDEFNDSYDGVFIFGNNDELIPLSSLVKVSAYNGKIRTDCSKISNITSMNKYRRSFIITAAQQSDHDGNKLKVVLSNLEYEFVISKTFDCSTGEYSYSSLSYQRLSQGIINTLGINQYHIGSIPLLGTDRGSYGGTRSILYYSGKDTGIITKASSTSIRVSSTLYILSADILQLVSPGIGHGRLDSDYQKTFMCVCGYAAKVRGALCIDM